MVKPRNPKVSLIKGTETSMFDLRNRIRKGELEPRVDDALDMPDGTHSQKGGEIIVLGPATYQMDAPGSASQTLVPEDVPEEPINPQDTFEDSSPTNPKLSPTQINLPRRRGYVISFLAGMAALTALGTYPCNPGIPETPVSYAPSTTKIITPTITPEDKIFTCTDTTISFKFKIPEIGTSQYAAAMVTNGWNNANLKNLCSMPLEDQITKVTIYGTPMFNSLSYDEISPILDLTKDVLTINKDKVQRLNLDNLTDGRNNVVNLNDTFTYPLPESLEEKVESREDRLQEASRLYTITDTSDVEYKPVKQIIAEAGVTVKEIKDLVGITRAELRRYQIDQRNEDIWRGYMESGCLKKSEYVKSIAQEYGLSRSRVYTILRNMALEVPDATHCF